MKSIVIFVTVLVTLSIVALLPKPEINANKEKDFKQVHPLVLPYVKPEPEVKPEIKPEPEKPKEPEKVLPELIEDHATAYARAKEKKKHLVIWINQFDQELYEALPEAIHTKSSSVQHVTSGTVVCCYKNNDLYPLIDLSLDNSIRLNYVPLTQSNLPLIKEYLKNPK